MKKWLILPLILLLGCASVQKVQEPVAKYEPIAEQAAMCPNGVLIVSGFNEVGTSPDAMELLIFSTAKRDGTRMVLAKVYFKDGEPSVIVYKDKTYPFKEFVTEFGSSPCDIVEPVPNL